MLQDKEAYDVALENFSLPLLPLVEYRLDYQGRMAVQNETALRYRFIDMTAQTEALFVFVERVIETDLVQELDFVRNYDTAKSALQAIVDMPDRLIDLFIRLCAQNKGVLSASKRRNHFSILTDEEVAQMQQAIKESHLVHDEFVIEGPRSGDPAPLPRTPGVLRSRIRPDQTVLPGNDSPPLQPV